MSRKHDLNSINLKVENVEPFEHDGEAGLVIEWSSDIGFGEYTFRSLGCRLGMYG